MKKQRTGWIAAAAAVWALAPGGMQAASAQPPDGTVPQAADRLADYARPHERIEIGGGRRLNLYCMGSGERTVLFDAGGSDWSVVWALVQPAVANRARACAYDRAGLGYSDPSAAPRSPAAIVEDLHALVRAAGLRTPLILVGHSLGGFNVKLYAALYPDDVAGLVLVDPAEERSDDRIRPRMERRYGLSLTARSEIGEKDFLRRLIAHYETCAAAARTADLDPQSPAYGRCWDPVRPALGPAIAAERARLQVRSAFQNAQASELANSVYGRTDGDAIYQRLFRPGVFGTRPLIVLTHGAFDASDPMDSASFQGGLWLHQETAALSRRGRQRTVPETGHYIELDAPQAVISAIFEVLDQMGRR
jgi:pimeloyl-ACP methyl ester carboxylesterase